MQQFGKKIFKTIKKKLKKKKKKKKIIPAKINEVNLEIKDIKEDLKEGEKEEAKDLENQIKETEDEFNLCKEGKIEFSKIHSSANRPLNKIGDFNNKTQFCPCCNLPAEQDNILMPFKFCDSIEKYSECGEGIFLYFAYFKFAIASLFVCSLIIGFTNIYYNFNCNKTLKNFCNK